SEVWKQVERLVFDRFAYDCERLDVLAPAARAFGEQTGQIFDIAELVPGRPWEAAGGEDLQGAAILSPLRGGGSSVGRAPGCGPGGRGFESPPPPSPAGLTDTASQTGIKWTPRQSRDVLQVGVASDADSPPLPTEVRSASRAMTTFHGFIQHQTFVSRARTGRARRLSALSRSADPRASR